MSNGKLTCGAKGVQISVRDLLVMYQAFLAANAEQSSSVTATEHGNPFKQVPTLHAPHIALSDDPLPKQSYGLGWERTMLQGSLGVTGINAMYVSAMPFVGQFEAEVDLSSQWQSCCILVFRDPNPRYHLCHRGTHEFPRQ